MAEKINILYEDHHILVCAKRAGLAVQSAGIGTMDLESLLKNELVRKGGSPYLAVVHRLDQPVEGILVFAKDPDSAASLSRQVQDGRMRKEYLALSAVTEKGASLLETLGDGQEKRLEDWLVKDTKSHMARIAKETEKGAKKALLYISLAADEGRAEDFTNTHGAGEGTSLLRVRLVTGRYHQIRAQLSHAGLPIEGDRRYGMAAGEAGNGRPQRDRAYPALCACCLAFLHPVTGEQMTFRIRPSFLEEV